MAVIQEIIVRPATSSTVDKIICDECGVHAFSRCVLCRADLCAKHRVQSPEDSGGDYTDYVCVDCYEVMRTYESDIKAAEEKLDAIYEERRKYCIVKRKKKNKINEANKT